MTSPADGVRFDIDGDGTREQIAWPRPGSGVGFLALDRNDNGTIDSGAELFGDASANNGFEALALLDSNHDGTVNPIDASWTDLLLWTDTNHDGVSASDEIVSLASSGVTAISTDYVRSGRRDQFGNELRYRGRFMVERTWRQCYDVYLVAAN